MSVIPISLSDEADRPLLRLLAARLSALRLPESEAGAADPTAVRNWLAQSRQLVADAGLAERRGEDFEQTWAAIAVDERHAGYLPRLSAAAAVLRALPDILTGRLTVADVLPEHTARPLVTPALAHTAVAVADMVEAYVDARADLPGPLPVRVLELAPTSGTPELRDRLTERQDLAEYVLEEPHRLAAQQCGDYDVVVARGVLGAALDVRQALRAAKSALKRHGLLVLDEPARPAVFEHLVHGLPPARPRPDLARWRSLLDTEGFPGVYLPTGPAADADRHVIVAESDGMVRRTTQPERRPVGPAPVESAPAVTPAAPRPASASALEPHVRDIVIDALGSALGLRPEHVELDVPFADFGINSLTGVELLHRINQELGTTLDSTVLFDHSSVEKLTAHILASAAEAVTTTLAPREPARPRTTTTTAAVALPDAAPGPDAPAAAPTGGIAVVGISGRFPRSADVDQLWEHLLAGECLVDEVTRWDLTDFYSRFAESPHGHTTRAGLLDDIDLFDSQFFGISGLEATYMDPQQRLFLEECWTALEDAGHAGRGVEGRACGVYAGFNGGDYQMLCGVNPPAQAMWGNAPSALSARISYLLDLQGPALTVDTACSSSLVAIQLACQSLSTGETDMALAGGVYITSTPGFLLGAGQAGMLSPDGRCYSFDHRANGFAPGEGVGVVVLKRYEDAVADGDHVYGVIRGWGTNQDGATNGITAPSARSQERLERQVYDRFGIDPARIGMVEAHGSATPLGDPIEFQALTRAFGAYTDRTGYCAIGSIKSNIGHTTSAAGVAGVLRVLLALRHRTIPPSVNFERANPAIDLDNGPFYLNTRPVSWTAPDDGPRTAAVSSFGLSGTNAHLVIEEAPGTTRVRPTRPAQLVVLSAQSAEQVRRQAERLLAACTARPDLDLADIGFTLLTGRRHHRHRFACVVGDVTELAQVLREWLDHGRHPAAHVSDATPRDRREQRPALRRVGEQSLRAAAAGTEATDVVEHLQVVADLYAQGYDLDYEELFRGGGHRRVPLPAYPFARERYWVPEPAQPGLTAGPTAPARPEQAAVPPAPVQAEVTEAGVAASVVTWLSGILAVPAERIETGESLIRYGFDSINAVALRTALLESYGVDLAPRAVFESGTVEDLAALVVAEHRTAAERPARPEPADVPDDEAPFPLSAAQRVLWSLAQLAPGNSAYHLPHAFRVRGEVRPDALEAALRRLVERHPALRTTVDVAGHAPVQTVRATAPVSCTVEQIGPRSDDELLSLVTERGRVPFDLTEGPLLRVHLLSLAPDDHVLVVTLHHIVFDGTSLLVLLRELAALYTGEVRGEPVPLPRPAGSYAEFVDWQRRFLADDRGAAARSYWRDRLAGAPADLGLPLDRPRTEAARFQGAVLQRRLPAALTGRVRDLGADLGASPFVVMLSAYTALLHQWTGRCDLVVGTPLHGRPEPRFQDTIGYFVNQVPIRTRVAGLQSFAELAAQVRTEVYEAFEHGDYPVCELGREGGTVQSSFVFQNWLKLPAGAAHNAPALALEPMLGVHQAGMFDLTLEVVQTDGVYTLLLLHNPALFDRETVASVADRYERLLAAVCEDPGLPVGRTGAPAEPPVAEPVPTKPVPAEPVAAEPFLAQPVPAEPAPAEPVPASRQAALGEAAVRAAVETAYRELLGVDALDPHDNFFDLGGHSVLLVQVSLRLREALGREVPSVALFQHPTVDSLTRHLASAATGPSYERSRRKGQARRAAIARLAAPV
ncbi:condensation domain-containing protein [Streptomyces sp. NBC_01235]|uniref:condensation domain-containing protein n=1 Tax=Streptomyces sp. NBC_01235 TaxID=2903788 RepID=UPI002E120BEA|nr:condensation domain-containing protein [Streptomyces sp. NBC_01235]